jgi:multisubunit Na+/H+ antiporter MnhC subunit
MIIVLGEPKFYNRFGFKPTIAYDIKPYSTFVFGLIVLLTSIVIGFGLIAVSVWQWLWQQFGF